MGALTEKLIAAATAPLLQEVAVVKAVVDVTDEAPVNERIAAARLSSLADLNNALDTVTAVPKYLESPETHPGMRNDVLRLRANGMDARLAALERDRYAIQGNELVVSAVADSGNTWLNGELQNPAQASTQGVASGDTFPDAHWVYTYRPLPGGGLGWIRTVKA